MYKVIIGKENEQHSVVAKLINAAASGTLFDAVRTVASILDVLDAPIVEFALNHLAICDVPTRQLANDDTMGKDYDGLALNCGECFECLTGEVCVLQIVLSIHIYLGVDQFSFRQEISELLERR